VDLAVPLGGRALVDVDGGVQVTVFRGADLLLPTVLPCGYRLAHVAPGYAPDGSAAAWDPATSTLFVSHDGPGRLWLVEEYGRHRTDGWPLDPPLVAMADSLPAVPSRHRRETVCSQVLRAPAVCSRLKPLLLTAGARMFICRLRNAPGNNSPAGPI
jgi:hypothetical protein